ncbi:MAG: ZIP family metal transporter [Candidatus Moranbacteria bacterium]|nr:ZIP family metal transporter [Candidatus Moranbacteria bacterium]
MSIWVYTIVSVLIVSLLSLLGLAAFPFGEEKIKKFLIWAVAFAGGTLLGDAFLHLIPEAYKEGSGIGISFSILAGMLAFFVLEKFIHWHHCHDIDCTEHNSAFSYVILIGDGAHNFIDGMIIAASYMVSLPIGIATTLAVVFHEIPHEIGDFASMLYGGFSKIKALWYNFLAGIVAIFGALIVLVVGQNFADLTYYLIPFAAGGFIYVASADIIPELHKSTKISHSFLQLLFIIAGIGIMYGLLIFG